MKIVDSSHPVKNELSIIDAKYIDGLRLRLKFNDGAHRTVDLRSFLERSRNPELRRYLNKSNFKKFELRNGNIVWNDFDMVFPIADLRSGSIS
jgi:hypothetical protein